jgi:anti-sigma B factor antagonist
MPTQLFDVRLRQTQTLAIMDLSGQVSRESDEALNRAYGDAIDGGAERVLLNFSQVDYINSTGIAVIVGLLARARADGRPLAVCGLTSHYRTIFEITRLVDFMQVFADEASALAIAGDTVA